MSVYGFSQGLVYLGGYRRCYSAHNPPSILDDYSLDPAMPIHPSPELRSLFEAALNEFESRAGTNLLQHQIFNKLLACQSIQSVLDIIQEQTKPLRTSQGDDSTLMEWIKRTVHVLHSFSTNHIVVNGVSSVCDYLCSADLLHDDH